MRMPDGVPPEAPSMWAVYFAVADCDTTGPGSHSLGGELFLPTMEMGRNRFAGATDPTGAMFFFGEFCPARRDGVPRLRSRLARSRRFAGTSERPGRAQSRR